MSEQLKLWRVAVTLDLELPVAAASAGEAKRIARESWQDELANGFADEDAWVGSPQELKQCPEGWRGCSVYGADGLCEEYAQKEGKECPPQRTDGGA